MKRKKMGKIKCVYIEKKKSDFSQQSVAIFFYSLIIECRGILKEGIMEEQHYKKIMMMASLSIVVCGRVYYFLYNPNIKESTVLTTKVNPTIESEVQENIEEKRKAN